MNWAKYDHRVHIVGKQCRCNFPFSENDVTDESESLDPIRPAIKICSRLTCEEIAVVFPLAPCMISSNFSRAVNVSTIHQYCMVHTAKSFMIIKPDPRTIYNNPMPNTGHVITLWYIAAVRYHKQCRPPAWTTRPGDLEALMVIRVMAFQNLSYAPRH